MLNFTGGEARLPRCDATETLPNVKQPAAAFAAKWLILVSLGVWQTQSTAGVYVEAFAIVYTLGRSRGVTAIAKITGGLVLLRM